MGSVRPVRQAIGAPAYPWVGTPRDGAHSHDSTSATWLQTSAIAVMAIVGVGFLFRLVAAIRLSPHVDEAASLLAARMTAERGVPILPSGTVYFQGATLSYLTTPLVWLGLDDLSALTLLRLPIVVIGTLSIPLAYRLGVLASGRTVVGLLAAGFVALDPLAVQWSGHLRMYGILQPLTLGLTLFLLLALRSPRAAGPYIGVAGTYWLAVFTHSGAALLLAPIAIAAFLGVRGPGSGVIRMWSLTIGAASVAPLTLLGLNRVLGNAGVSGGGESSSSPGFVGDHLLGIGWLRSLQSGGLLAGDPVHLVPSISTLSWLLPMTLVGIASLFAAGRCWRTVDHGVIPTGLPVLLAMFWVPTAAVWITAVEPRARYHVHSLVVGYVLVAMVSAVPFDGGIRRWARLAPVLPTLALAILAVSLVWRLSHPTVHPDYRAATAYVAAERGEHDPVIAALPAGVFLELGATAPLRFLAGPADRPRVERLTRTTPDGDLTDYWIGVPAITSASDLMAYLAAHPTTWIIVDQERLTADWAYAGPIADALTANTVEVHRERGGAVVLRPEAAPADHAP